MKGKDSALSRERNLAKIKLSCNDSCHRDVRLDEKKQTHRRLVNKLFVNIWRFFLIPHWRVDFTRIFSKKKKKKKNHVDNFRDFRWIGHLKSFNLRRFFRWALGSRGGTCPKCPPWIRAWLCVIVNSLTFCSYSLTLTTIDLLMN